MLNKSLCDVCIILEAKSQGLQRSLSHNTKQFVTVNPNLKGDQKQQQQQQEQQQEQEKEKEKEKEIKKSGSHLGVFSTTSKENERKNFYSY
jgi:ribosomal protein L12E/L44/L45/RPP1/RPP2